MRKVYMKITAEIIFTVDDGVEMDDVVSSLEMQTDDDRVTIENTEIKDHEVTDSK